MENYFIASIDWLSGEQGGRKAIPKEGTRYCPLLKISSDVDSMEWSIDFICPDFNETNIIKFKFLVNTAPSHLIEKNSKYEIYEGNRKVAEVKIIH